MINNVAITNEVKSLKVEIELKSSYFVKSVLIVVFSLSILLPLSGLIAAASNQAMSFGLLIGLSLFFFFISRPLFKQVMWHCYGKESFIITNESIIYEPYIKYFKSDPEQFEYKNLEVLFSDRELERDERIGSIIFLDGEKKIKSALKILESDFETIVNKINANKLIPTEN